MRKNDLVAKILYEVADLLELENVPWKPQAYRKAAQTIENLSEDVAEIARQNKLETLPGVGKAIEEKIEEILRTGKLAYLETLKKETPVDIDSFFKIEGLGPRTITHLYKTLGVRSINDLKRAAEEHKIQALKGLGAKKEQQILAGINHLRVGSFQRFPRGLVVPIAEDIVSALQKTPGTTRVVVAGSYRRGKETVGDLDILVVSSRPTMVMKEFISLPDVHTVLAHGDRKSSARFTNGLPVDVRVVAASQYGSAIQYFTGSKEHAVPLRKLALKKGYTLSEYGLFRRKDKKRVAGVTEESIYRTLGLQFIHPEMRENLGELELAQKHRLPQLVTLQDIHGDFQTQTAWSDGKDSIEAMAHAAQQRGYTFLVITDHVGGIGIANPLDAKRLAQQRREIDRVQKKVDITIFQGAEIDIKKNGELALAKKDIEALDVVLASIHFAFRLPEAEMTKRIQFALEEYPVTVFAHPTARLINKRDPIAFDKEAVFQTAKNRGVFLEIDGQTERMDLSDTDIHLARELGCKFVLSSDAHRADQLRFIENAVLNARRGWLEKKHVLNTASLAQIEKRIRMR